MGLRETPYTAGGGLTLAQLKPFDMVSGPQGAFTVNVVTGEIAASGCVSIANGFGVMRPAGLLRELYRPGFPELGTSLAPQGRVESAPLPSSHQCPKTR